MAYTSLTKFKFWCQKVIPLIYDDSLSYYEVLCKIRDYINDIITNLDSLADEIEALEQRMQTAEGDISDIKEQLENISETIIDAVKEYLTTEDFIERLIQALEGDENFINWLGDTLVNNDNFYHDFIDKILGDENFYDDFINKIMGDENFFETLANNSYFQNIISGSTSAIKNALVNLTDYYQRIRTKTYTLQSALSAADLPCLSGYFAIDNIATQGGNKTKFKAYVDCYFNYFNAKPVVSEVGGITTITFDDTETAYDSFLIDKSNFENKNLLFELLNSANVATIYQIKDGSIASDYQSVSTDQTITTQTQSGLQSGYYEPPKKNNANVVVVSFERADASLITCNTCKRVFINFDWNGLNGNIVLPYNTNLILWDDLTVPTNGTELNIDIYVPNNRLGQIVFGILGYCFYKNDTKITNIEVTVTDNSEEIETLKNSCGNGKALVASAITDKGVPTSATDTFQTMANNIRAIETGDPLTMDLVTYYTDTETYNSKFTYFARGEGEAFLTHYQRVANYIGWILDDFNNDYYLIHPSGDSNNGFLCIKETSSASNNVYTCVNGTITDQRCNGMFNEAYILKTLTGFTFGGTSGTSTFVAYDKTTKNKGFFFNLSYAFYFDDNTNIMSNINLPRQSNLTLPTYDNKTMQLSIPIILNQSYDDPDYTRSLRWNGNNRALANKYFIGDNSFGLYWGWGSTYGNAIILHTAS